MRWRFADKVDAFEPWKRIQGRKGVSLEEYSLLERFGRKGVLPETLVLESCVQFARWLAVISSDYHLSCILVDIKEFAFGSEARMGNNLRVTITLMSQTDRLMDVTCEVRAEEQIVAQGAMILELVALEQIQDPGNLRIIWKELYGAA